MLNKVKRIAALSLTFLMLAGLVSIVAWAEQGASDTEAPAAGADASADNLASYRKAAENDRLILYVNKQTLGIKVQDKENGYVWDGALDEKDEKLNKSWQSFFESGLSVEYMDSKRKVSTVPVTAGQAKIAVENLADGFSANVDYDKLGISLKMEVRLTDDAVEFKVPEASIQETNQDNRLQSLYMYPFFGATKGVQPDQGYMLIPDGSGALISLNEQTVATQPYIGRVYGDDLGMKGSPKFSDSPATPVEQVYLPVFGIARSEGKNAFASMITGGAPYAEIRSYPSGVTTAYNWTTAKWIYRENYFQPVDKKGKGITLNQEEKNKFDASMKIMLLSGEKADYSGMAGRVQSEMVQRGELPAKKQDGANSLPLRIELFAADNQKKMIGHEVIPMTTVKQMDSMLDDLRANHVERMMVVVRGYTEGGATGASPTHLPFEGKVGSGADWKAFVEKYKELGIPVYFYTDYVTVAPSADGYGKGDIARSISKQLISFFGRSYYLQPAVSVKLFENEISSFNKYGINNIAMDSIGGNLFSTYVKHAATRSGSIETYESMLSHDEIGSLALYRPNYYLWKFADRIMDLPTGTSSFLLESEEVPFLQLVLKGYIDYYAQASNFNANPQKEQLRMIDYGSYPSFILTDEDPIKLANTESSWSLFTSQYTVWKDQVVKEYRTIVDALEPVAGATFEKREKVQEGVFRNRYSNGTVIYVNYNINEVTADGNTIPAQGFLVLEGGRS
ncbi:DUF5696 domain-containing protein [Paenibacillus thermotolerans]|uniref:DUF5696 domain-containing protein n=1 Tax=Paenibacillus thermotolerans TaxID=3027807 RepID=UPI002368F03E|nr:MULTISPECIES: DUF5696 domain-containing protein [unclassified Paenibacillus]